MIAGLTLTACSPAETPPVGSIDVVATTSIVADVVSQIVGDLANLTVLMPNGSDPHETQLTAKQAAQLREADLIVGVGLGLEGAVSDALADAASDGVRILELGPLLTPRHFPDGSPDPHVWLDPSRMADGVMLIAEALSEIDPTIDWATPAEAYAAVLMDTDAEISRLVASLPADRRAMVTNHDAFGYFADRYGLEVVGVVIPGGSTLADPSSAEIARLVDIIDSLGVPAIFAETTSSDRLARAIADETKDPIAVVELMTESLAPAGEPGDSLVSLLLVDAERIVQALGATP